MRTIGLALVLLLAVAATGSVGIPLGIHLHNVQLVQGGGPDPGDCFLRINDSTHSGGPGSAGLLIVSGYALNACSRPMANLVVRGSLVDTDGKTIAVAETPKTAMGSGDIVAYTLVFDTPCCSPFSYRLEPVIRSETPFF